MSLLPLRKRRKDGSTALLVAFVLGCVALISMPGFLYFFFWEQAGWVISTLIGFLVGCFALSLLEVLLVLAKVVRRVFRGSARREDAPPRGGWGR